MIFLDTSVIIAALTGDRTLGATLHRVLAAGERLGLCTPVLYEWERGRRTTVELATQEQLLPGHAAWPFGAAEARVAAVLYRELPRARHRELDLAIAACALTSGASLWTLNRSDFSGIAGLSLFDPSALG